MPSYDTWEFPRSGSKAKDGEEKKEERERERLNDGNNNGQATHGARKHAWRTQDAWAKNTQSNSLFRYFLSGLKEFAPFLFIIFS